MRIEVIRLACVIFCALLCGDALAQRYGPPHAGAAATGGNGGLKEFLLAIVVIIVGVIILTIPFALLKWLMSLLRALWGKLRGILR